MSFYKIDRKKDGKQGYRVFVRFTNPDGKRITKKQMCVRVAGSLHQKTKEPTFYAGSSFLCNKSVKLLFMKED